MIETPDPSGPVAILVVHGIGAQERGESARKLMAGLARVDGSLDPREFGGPITVGGRPVRLHEVYWADLLKGDMTRGAFQMAELQSLSWYPWFNVRCRNYQTGSYSRLKLAWWCVALPIFNFFALFAYYGAGLVAQILQGPKPERKDSDANLWERAKEAADAARPTAIDSVLDEYVGDILSYINSAGRAFYREDDEPQVPANVLEAYPRIVDRFYEQLLAAEAAGPVEIQVVAHSLGRALPVLRTSREPWRDRVVLLGETLFAPAAAVVVLLTGMALFAITALLLPFLASLVLRQFLPEPTWVHIENISALIFAGLMIGVFLIVPFLRATRVHRLHWVASRSAGQQ